MYLNYQLAILGVRSMVLVGPPSLVSHLLCTYIHIKDMYMWNQVIWTKSNHVMLVSFQRWHFVDDFDYIKPWRNYHDMSIFKIYRQQKSYSKTFLVHVGYVALANIYPWVGERWNRFRNKVIFLFSHLSTWSFEKFHKKKHSSLLLLKWYAQIFQWCMISYQGIELYRLVFHPTLIRLMWSLGRDKHDYILMLHIL